MKPITNILLIAAIICYVFLPFRTMDLAGSITGLSYSAGLITENFSLLKTIFALLPFIACFAGKPDFFFETWDLNHDPELIGDQAARMEGFKVKELNIGYYASNTLMWMSLVSCIISLFPFKFNQTLERTIDDSIERSLHRSKEGITKVHKELQEEITHLESKAKQTTQSPEPAPSTPPDEASEDHTKYMPKN